jgi:hypothetical protein
MAVDLQHWRDRWDAVDRAQGKIDEEKWKIAEAMWKANKEDRIAAYKIGLKVGRHERTVRFWVQLWARRAEYEDRGCETFSQAYSLANGDKYPPGGYQRNFIRSSAKRFLRDATTEEVEQMFMKLPDQTRAKQLAKAAYSVYRKKPTPQGPDTLLKQLDSLVERLAEMIVESDDPETLLSQVATSIWTLQVMLRKADKNGKPKGRATAGSTL